MSEVDVRSVAGGIRFAVHVQPRASKSETAGVHGAALKVRLHAPPVDGAANEELVSFLANSLGVAKRSVRIVSGLTSRSKMVEIDGVFPDSVRALAEGAGSR